MRDFGVHLLPSYGIVVVYQVGPVGNLFRGDHIDRIPEVRRGKRNRGEEKGRRGGEVDVLFGRGVKERVAMRICGVVRGVERGGSRRGGRGGKEEKKSEEGK